MRAAALEICATAPSQRWVPAEVLRALLAEEIRGRDRAMHADRRRAAGCPAGKAWESWQSDASSIPRPTQQALITLEWLGRAENLGVCRPSGIGKSHLCEALAATASDQGHWVVWFTLETLTNLLGRATVDGSVANVVTRITGADLIVIADIGLLPAVQAAAEAFYRVVYAAYERHSVAVTSNLHPASFDAIMPKTLAPSAVDRLLHHAHPVLTEGTSHRLAEATAGTGVLPLAQTTTWNSRVRPPGFLLSVHRDSP